VDWHKIERSRVKERKRKDRRGQRGEEGEKGKKSKGLDKTLIS
jgi:hypothetical protein